MSAAEVFALDPADVAATVAGPAGERLRVYVVPVTGCGWCGSTDHVEATCADRRRRASA